MKDKVCFFCTTPYQIFTTINIVKKEKFDADIYIVNQFKNYKEISKELKKTPYFKNVIIVDEKKYIKRSKNKFVNYIYLIWIYSLTDCIVNDFFLNKNYSKIFITSKFLIGRLVCFHYLKSKGNIEFNYFDDGIGTYCNSNLYKTNLYDRIIQLIFFRKDITTINFNYYLYNIDLYNHMYKDNTNKLYQIYMMEQSDENKKTMNRIFNIHRELISERYIFFDTIRPNELEFEGIKLLENIVKEIKFVVGKNNIVFKAHPRDKNKDLNLKYISNDEVPFEVLCFSNDYSNKILITNISTAVFTPKLLYGREPIIIFMNYIFDKTMKYECRINILIEKFKEIYNSNLIYTPKTKEELIELLYKLKINIEKERL